MMSVEQFERTRKYSMILILFNILIIKNKNEVILYLNAKKNK